MTDVAEIALRADAREITKADAALDKLDKTAKRTETSTEKLNRQNEVAAKRFSGLSSSVLSYVAAFASLAAATRAVTSSIRIVAEFGQSMAEVSAITRATKEELTQMETVARRLGATTEFTASQAASAFKFMGMAGFTAKESIAAIPDVLNLATAAALDLGSSADIVSNVMSGFGISADNAARATDVLAAISSRANTDVRQLGDGIKYVGPVAAAMGIDIGDAAAAMGVLSDAGIQGSAAGTGLRRVLSSLASPTNAAREVLDRLNISVGEVNPATNALTDIVSRLAASGLSAADALEIFGDRGGPAILALVENNPRLKELTTAMSDVEGEAQRMAETMRDTLTGDAKALNSALQELALVIGGSQESAMRGALQSVTGFVRELGIELQAFTSYSLDSGEASVAAANDYNTTAMAIQTLLNLVNIATVEFEDLGNWIGYMGARLVLLGKMWVAANKLQFSEVGRLYEQGKAMDQERAAVREAAEQRIVDAMSAQMSASKKLREQMAADSKVEISEVDKIKARYEKLGLVYDQIESQMSELAAQQRENAEEASEFADALRKVQDQLDPQGAKLRTMWEQHDILTEAMRRGIDVTRELDALWKSNGVSQFDARLKKARDTIDEATAVLFEMKKEADPLATAYERGVERMDDAFAGFFKTIIRDGKVSFDSLKDIFLDTLAEMIYAAARNRILIGVGIGGGSAGALASTASGSGGLLSSLGSIGSMLSGGIGGSLIGGISSIGSALGLGAQTGAFLGSTGQLGYNALSALGIQGAGGTTSFLAGGALTAGAGILGGLAGNALGSSLTGRTSNSSWGAGLGGTAGAFLGGPLGAAIGGAIGGALDSAFGSSKNRIGGVGINTGTREANLWGTKRPEYQDPMRELAEIIQAFSDSVGGSGSIMTISRGNKSPLKLDEQEFSNVADLLSEAMDRVLKTAGNLSPVVRELAIAFDGTVEETALFAQSMQALSDMTKGNSVSQAVSDYAASQQTVYQAYTAQLDTVRQLTESFDGSVGSANALTQALSASKTIAYQMALQIEQLKSQVSGMFQTSAQAIRESVMSEEQIMELRKNERRDLRQSLSTINDADVLVETLRKIDSLNNEIFRSLEDPTAKQAEAFANYAERTAEIGENQLDRILRGLEQTQQDSADRVNTALSNAASSMQSAADTQARASEMFAGAVASLSARLGSLSFPSFEDSPEVVN